MRIIVMGYIVRGPLAGMAWHPMQYVLGLKQLGHEVYYFEDSDDYPSCYDPLLGYMQADPAYGLAFAKRMFDRLSIGDGWAYFDAHRQTWHGPMASSAQAIGSSADLLLNISGINPLRDWAMKVPQRVLVDTDPVFLQVRHLTKPDAMTLAKAHQAFFTFGENVGRPGCTMPDDGLDWKPTRQPVAVDCWPVRPLTDASSAAWSTVMQWDSYASCSWNGRQYGMKSASFKPYFDMPTRCPKRPLELALGSGAPNETLAAHGWRLRVAQDVTIDPWGYQDYLAESFGEWSIAKEGYASTRSGWFSERSCSYLALGRPVVVQETGISDFLPTGDGVLTFTNLDQAIEAIRRVESDWSHHAQAARRWVVEHFEARRVLSDMLARL